MPGKLKPTSIISSPLFNGTSPLTHEDFLSLSVAGYGKPAEHLLNDLNWSKEVICITGLKLAPDNLRVINSSVFLIGALLKDKRVNVTNYWPFTSPTSLTISIPDSTVFQFNNGALYSDYVNSTAFHFSFSHGSSQLKDLNLEFSWPRIQPRVQSNFPPDILSEGNLFCLIFWFY